MVSVTLDDKSGTELNRWIARTVPEVGPPYLEVSEAVAAMIIVSVRYPDVTETVASQIRHQRAVGRERPARPAAGYGDPATALWEPPTSAGPRRSGSGDRNAASSRRGAAPQSGTSSRRDFTAGPCREHHRHCRPAQESATRPSRGAQSPVYPAVHDWFSHSRPARFFPPAQRWHPHLSPGGRCLSASSYGLVAAAMR